MRGMRCHTSPLITTSCRKLCGVWSCPGLWPVSLLHMERRQHGTTHLIEWPHRAVCITGEIKAAQRPSAAGQPSCSTLPCAGSDRQLLVWQHSWPQGKSSHPKKLMIGSPSGMCFLACMLWRRLLVWFGLTEMEQHMQNLLASRLTL